MNRRGFFAAIAILPAAAKAAQAAPVMPPLPPKPIRPNPDDFDSFEDWDRAYVRYEDDCYYHFGMHKVRLLVGNGKAALITPPELPSALRARLTSRLD